MIINNIIYDVIGFDDFEDSDENWGYFYYKVNDQIATKPIQNSIAKKHNMINLSNVLPIMQGIYLDIMNMSIPINIYYEYENCLLVSDMDYGNLHFCIIRKSEIIEYTYEYKNLDFIKNL